METKSRSLLKALVWQVIGFVSMVSVGLVITGSLKAGGTMAVVNSGLGFVVYLVYERVWSRVAWGQMLRS